MVAISCGLLGGCQSKLDPANQADPVLAERLEQRARTGVAPDLNSISSEGPDVLSRFGITSTRREIRNEGRQLVRALNADRRAAGGDEDPTPRGEALRREIERDRAAARAEGSLRGEYPAPSGR